MVDDPPAKGKTVKERYGPRWLLLVFLVVAALQAVILLMALPWGVPEIIMFILLLATAIGSLVMFILSCRAQRSDTAGGQPEDPMDTG
ncbi:hypothetical protein [Arthrobacter sp. H14]|uniref:hypothetical protein n=1 Tax=Arthrobacter sp. H14 TaxID=1312959 RepID=UPI00047D7F39|nr:hypothetical protein [Arthrobacter sp. H14]